MTDTKQWAIRYFFVSIFFNWVCVSAEEQSADLASNVIMDFDGIASVRRGWLTAANHELALEQNQLVLNWGVTLSERIQVKAEWRALTEQRLEPTSFHQVAWRALFLQWTDNDCTSKVGIQQVVWGASDRLRVLDLIHPHDLREWYFAPFSDSRLPLAMMNLECGTSDGEIQVLLIPQTKFNQPAKTGGRFATPAITDYLGAFPYQHENDLNAGDWRDWQYALRWGGRLAGIDYTVNAFNGWYPERIASQRYDAEQTLFYEFEPKRFKAIGASASMPFDAVVLRSELLYSRTEASYGFEASSGLLQSTEVPLVKGLIGIDYQAGHWFFGAQYYAERRDDLPYQALQSSRERLASLSLRRELWQDRFHLQGFAAHDLSNDGRYYAVEAHINFNDSFYTLITLDKFSGDKESYFGRFAAQSRVTVTLQYSF